MKVLVVVSEVEPFAKTGGLADVAGALPKALARLGHDVRIVMPRYRQVDPARFGLRPTKGTVRVDLGGRLIRASVWEARLPARAAPSAAGGPQSEVTAYFVEQPALFDRDGLYQEEGTDYPDNLERFSVFCQTALRMLPQLHWQPDIIHAHDWQAALACAHLAFGPLSRESFFSSAGTVFTVHNMSYQGLFPRAQWPATGLPEAAFGVHGLEFYGQVNCLKGGLASAGRLTTVSPTYATEIQTPAFGCGLDGVLRTRREDLVGILNGIDPEEWNPQTDPSLSARYTADRLAGKALCKLALQRACGLPERHDLLIGMIQRLVEQKGLDLLMQAMQRLMALPLQLVILGTGDAAYAAQLSRAAKQRPERLHVRLAFDAELAHQIEAGADAFLMPSQFEPCGLNQMYSMRYGTVPIVRRIGGLADTVTDVTTSRAKRSATGFVFEDYTPEALLEAVTRALAAFHDHGLWIELMQTGMRQDFSWDRSAREYVKVYERLLTNENHQSPTPNHQTITNDRSTNHQTV